MNAIAINGRPRKGWNTDMLLLPKDLQAAYDIGFRLITR